jgi:hypothetical protein
VTAYKIRQNSDQDLQIADDDSVVVYSGVSIIDPSVNVHSAVGLTDVAGIEDALGGDNRVSILGAIEGFVGAYFEEGANLVDVGAGGSSYGYNAGVEFHDGGHNELIVRAGGEVSSYVYAVWFGDRPHVDYTDLPDSGTDTIHNFGLIEGIRREAVRMVFGDNHIVNSGTIKADFWGAIEIESAVTDPRNFISNTGSIIAGPRGPAITSGDAAMSVLNNGQITGDVQFGAGDDRYAGNGTITGTIYGGAGADRLIGGTGDVSFCGGAGADYLRDGSGVNTFIYNAASESTGGLGIDTIDRFDFSKDHIVISGSTLTSFEHITTPHDLQPGEAALLESTTGEWFLMVDANGVAGYQAGEDYMIKMTHAVHMP